MSVAPLQQQAARLLALHDRRQVLVLPNVWDVASARVVEEAGFPALATSSVGSGLARAALTAARRAAVELRDSGTYSFTEGILTHAQVNALLGPR